MQTDTFNTCTAVRLETVSQRHIIRQTPTLTFKTKHELQYRTALSILARCHYVFQIVKYMQIKLFYCARLFTAYQYDLSRARKNMMPSSGRLTKLVSGINAIDHCRGISCILYWPIADWVVRVQS